jgi:L-ribulose-5-phosphate 4-epimerase
VTELRKRVCALHAKLVRNNLVAWTSGSASAWVPGRELTMIKLSGVSYDDLTPESMVVRDPDKTKAVDLRQGPEELYFLGCHFRARMSWQLRGTVRDPKAA